jgi:hypothetical protein
MKRRVLILVPIRGPARRAALPRGAGRLFDEPPTALSLAGFIAARYTFEVLDGIDGPVTRASALAAFQKRREIDLGGFRISYQGQRRSASFATQSMLTPDGRVVG